MVEISGEDPVNVKKCKIGIDDELGIVQGNTRKDIESGNYWKAPKGTRFKKCKRIWYERKRKEFPGDRYWYHDLEDGKVALTLDKATKGNEKRITAYLHGPDIYECDEPGEFLCG